MNEYKKALNTIGDTLTYYMLGKGLASLPSDNEIYDSMETLRELVEKETSKKPIDVEFGPCCDLMLCCPTCKHGVVPIPTYNVNKYYPRCPFCGQLLEGEMRMNAREMFKKLGYKYNKYRDRNRMIEYRKEDSTSVLFWIKEREFSVSEYCEPKDITVDEFKAIQKQMEELGWI